MGNMFSSYLPHFTVERATGIDFADRIKPLGVTAEQATETHASAEERGRREGHAQALAELERLRQQDQTEFARRLAEREREIMELAADVLTDQLTAGLKRIEASIAEQVARVLAPFLDAAVRERAVEELSQRVATLLSGGGVRISVTGTEALVSRLGGRLAARGDGIAYQIGDGTELTVAIDDTVVETQIAAWGERIAASSLEPHG